MRFVIGNIDGKALGLNANELCVLEAIGKCSRLENAKGWYGSILALADYMPFKIDHMTVDRAVKKLLNLGLIERRENKSLHIAQIEKSIAQNENPIAQNEKQIAQNETNSTPLNNPPININNNSMKRNELIAHANMRDAQPVPSSFEDFLSAYQAKAGKWQVPESVLRECQNLWTECPEWKRKMLIKRINDGSWLKPRIDWTISDFNPQPHNYNGDRSISTADIERMIQTGQLVTAKWNGSWGKYTSDDVTDFALESYTPTSPSNPTPLLVNQ